MSEQDAWIHEELTQSDAYLHRVDRVLIDVQTPFQRVRVIDGGVYGKKLFLDDIVQSATGDEFVYHESLVQPAMLAACAVLPPRRVLILGGGEGATLREVLRWSSVERAVMVDIDRGVVEACRAHLPEMHQGAFDDPRAELVFDDAVQYARTSREAWDVIISDITEPVDDGPSNFCFTREYFDTLRKLLMPGGVLVTQSGPVTPVLIGMHARVTRTLRRVFSHVHSYSAGIASYAQPWGFTLATDAPLLARLEPVDVDRRLRDQVRGRLRFLDGASLSGLLQAPVYAREAIAAETRIYTDADLPGMISAAGQA